MRAFPGGKKDIKYNSGINVGDDAGVYGRQRGK